jgi:hypothetical protein
VTVSGQRTYDAGPMPGLELTREQIPGNVQSVTSEDIKKSHSLNLGTVLNSQMESVNVNDYQGNPFQMDVTYRGFTASPQLGTPQGLSVFFDGIRVNEPFGDVVNWDLIPVNALASVDMFPGSNPVFGLGTLGGRCRCAPRAASPTVAPRWSCSAVPGGASSCSCRQARTTAVSPDSSR